MIKPRLKFFNRRWVIIVLVILGAAGAGVMADYLYYRDRLYPGVYLADLALGGLRLAEAEKRLKEALWAERELTFIINSEISKSCSLPELGIAWDRERTLQNLYLAGRGWRGLRQRIDYLLQGRKISAAGSLNVDETLLARFMAGVAALVYQAPRDAYFTVAGERVSIEPEEGGSFLKTGALREGILASFYRPGHAITVPVGIWPAARTAAELRDYGVDRVMVSFQTDVSPAIPNRVQNIRLGAAAINGCLLAPGDIFSFAETVGRTTREKGYLEAPIIVGEELVPGLGGGLCQVSSTLYNAALLANLPIVERYNHSMTVAYLPPGRDATVSIGYADLKFKNDRDHYLLIGADLTDYRLTFRLFGPPMKERVEIVSSGLQKVPSPVRYEETDQLPAGTTELVRAGKPGYQVSTWRVVYRGDQEISRELLDHDYYKPTTTVYLVGTGKKNTIQ